VDTRRERRVGGARERREQVIGDPVARERRGQRASVAGSASSAARCAAPFVASDDDECAAPVVAGSSVASGDDRCAAPLACVLHARARRWASARCAAAAGVAGDAGCGSANASSTSANARSESPRAPTARAASKSVSNGPVRAARALGWVVSGAGSTRVSASAPSSAARGTRAMAPMGGPIGVEERSRCRIVSRASSTSASAARTRRERTASAVSPKSRVAAKPRASAHNAPTATIQRPPARPRAWGRLPRLGFATRLIPWTLPHWPASFVNGSSTDPRADVNSAVRSQGRSFTFADRSRYARAIGRCERTTLAPYCGSVLWS